MTRYFSPGCSEKPEGARRWARRLRFGPPLVSLTALVWAGQAFAQTSVSTDTTTPLVTSKAGDVTVAAGGTIRPTVAGAAVTVDSNNSVTNGGAISFHNLDNTTGVLVLGGHTASVTNNASITNDEDSASTTDSNGVTHGPFAKGTNRFGIRLTGPGTVTGSISNPSGGTITVIGNNSAAVSVETGLAGSISSAGTISLQGDNGVALRATGPVSGDVTLSGSIAATGQGSQAVVLGDVGGAVNIGGTISSTGYRYSTRSTDPTFLKRLQADDLLQGGAAVTIAGSVGKGILLDSVTTTTSGVTTTTASSVTSSSAAPALVVGAVGRDIAIGDVGTGGDAYGIEIKGVAQGVGVYDGVASAGVQIGVAGGGAVTTGGGLHITGTVASTAYAADATALHLMSGAAAPVLRNDGTLSAALASDAAGASAKAVVIDSGAHVTALQNSATLTASVTGQAGNAVAVQDRSGTLSEVENIRDIKAIRTLNNPAVAVTGQAIALDLSANSGGVHIIQTDPSAGVTLPSIVGEIRTGSGGDRLEFLAGTVTGDMTLGAGANALTVDGGAVVKGALTAQGGTLALAVGNGTLQVNSASQLSLTSLNLGATSTTILTADPANNIAGHLDVAGNATIASGAKIGVRLASLLDRSATYTLIRADHLTSGSIDSDLLGSVPFLYDSTLTTNAAAGTVSATLTRKTAAELNLPAATAAAFDPLIQAVNRDVGLRSALLAQTNRTGLINLYNQLLPTHSSSIFDATAATAQAFAQPLDDRQDAHGGGVWLQETNIGLISNSHGDEPGYKAWSFGLVGGYELPATALGVLGVSVGFATNTVYPDNVDSAADLHANMMEAGVYWRATRGGFSANARLAGDYVRVSSDRVISVLGEDGLAVNRTSSGRRSGYAINARVAGSYEAVFGGHYYVRPLASLDYIRLTEGSYSESGGGTGMDLAVESRTSSRLTAFAGVALGAVYGAQREWGPEISLGYKGVATQDLGVTTARFVSGGDAFTLRSDDVSGQGAAARLSLKGENGSGAFAVEGGAETRDGLSIYNLRLAGHIQF